MQIKGIFGKGRQNTGRKELRGPGPDTSKREASADSQTGSNGKASKRKLDRELAQAEEEDEGGADTGPDAYSALLTLLKSHKEPAGKKAKLNSGDSSENEEEDEEDQDADQVEGINLGSDEEEIQEDGDEDEDEGEDEDEDEDDGDGGESIDIEEQQEHADAIELDDNIEDHQDDPYYWHFSHVDEDVLDRVTRREPLAMRNRKVDLMGPKSVLSLVDAATTSGAPLVSSEPKCVSSCKTLPLKHRLRAPFSRANPQWSQTQSEFAGALFNYQDILYPNVTLSNADEIQRLCALHALNHVYKARDVILRHNAELEEKRQGSIKRAVVNVDEQSEKEEEVDEEEQQEEEKEEQEEEDDDKYRDQGFTRPRVVILCPTRNAAYEFVQDLIAISGLKQVENKKRFKSAFYDEWTLPEYKPADFRKLFKGNSNDMFCLGVRFTAASMRLYASFYASDIIIASPLGLRMIVTSSAKNKQDYDFLSSVEIAMVAGADAMQMQSWENVQLVFKHMNLVPKEQHDCDFSRLRMPFVNEKMKFLRQTIILSQYRTPEINSLFHKNCANVSGRLRARVVYKGVLGTLGFRVKQIFSRVPNSAKEADPTRDPDLRFKYFTAVVLPAIMRGATQQGTLIYVPSYIDFVRIRNYFDDQNIPGKCISEYSSNSEITRSRALFASGKLQILVYTERLHHFRRYDFRGLNQLVMYGAPENPEFYREIVRFFLKNPNFEEVSAAVKVLYTKWDSLKLERIVGTTRVAALLGENDAYEFY